VAKLQEEVTRARAIIVMAETRATRAERVAQERVVLLASTHVEVDEAVRTVSLLEGELVVACRALNAVKAELPSLVDKAVAADRLWEEAEGQCEHLVEELTLLWLTGSELCLTIVGGPLQGPLYEGMRFTAAHYTRVIARLSTL
jgi:hypothetical protein